MWLPLFILIVAFAIILSLPGKDISFTEYSVKPYLPLKGALAMNNKLNGAERLFNGEMKGPESLVVYNDELYTGLHGGYIVKIEDDKIIPIKKFGKDCEGFHDEKNCGRVLGMKFDQNGILYAADAYNGLYKLNVTSGKEQLLVHANQIIAGKPCKLLNSVDVALDGTIYFTVSSTTIDLQNGVYSMLSDGDGRLIKLDPATGKFTVLIDNLQFANGVVLSSDESFVIVAETIRSRIHRYYLKGPKKGTSDIFIEGLPGLPDNLKREGSTFLIPLLKPIENNKAFLPHTLGEYAGIRKFLYTFLTLIDGTFELLSESFPSSLFLKKAHHWVGHFESVDVFSHGTRVTVVLTNEAGDIVESLHSEHIGWYPEEAGISDICDIEPFRGYYYLGSPFNNYLARVKIS
ncbi:adipocyte plasma membrane-associated protein [Nilaparvata lugens]|uniref:adipocyte plasma membrane-associated protein n=1 Tax=Nilaparvata lugens TaxID=108931 RepID=UPI00193DAA8A|nr:adipocyte plasma membrane-associated protein [Nilaparvata lugens]